MPIEAHPAELSSLPAILRAVPAGNSHPTETISCDLTPWCAEVGRAAADVAALLFRLPMPEGLRDVFEDEIRTTVGAHALDAGEAVERHCQDVAWLGLRSTTRAPGAASLRRGGMMRFVAIPAKLTATYLNVLVLRLHCRWVCWRIEHMRWKLLTWGVWL